MLISNPSVEVSTTKEDTWSNRIYSVNCLNLEMYRAMRHQSFELGSWCSLLHNDMISFSCMCRCVYCMCVCGVCMWVCKWLCLKTSQRMPVSSSVTLRGLDIYVRLGQLARKVLGPVCLWNTHTQPCPSSYTGARNLNPDPILLSMDPSPAPQQLFLKVFAKRLKMASLRADNMKIGLYM